MEVVKKLVPVVCLMSAYVRWIKPRLLSATASKGGKSLLLHLCAQSRVLIPMIVITAFWILDADMQIETSISLTLNRNVRITLGPDGRPRAEDDDEDDDDDDDNDDDDDDDDGEDGGGTDDDDDDDDTYTINSYSDNSSTCSDNECVVNGIQNALQEFAESSLSREELDDEHHHSNGHQH